IRDMSVSYARIMFLGMPGFFLFLIITSIMRGVGDTITPLFALILSLMVSVVLTPALIQGWAGLPQVGVNAAAWAFITGFVVVLVFLYFYMRARNMPLAPDAAMFRALRPDMKLLGLILKLGIPSGLQMI